MCGLCYISIGSVGLAPGIGHHGSLQPVSAQGKALSFPFHLSVAAAPFTQPDSWRGGGKPFADEVFSSPPPVSFLIWVCCPASCCGPHFKTTVSHSCICKGCELSHYFCLALLLTPACTGIQEVSGKAGGCRGLGWCLWDARHLGRWETCASGLLSSHFSFQPAVWHWGLLSLIDSRVCGKSYVYTVADLGSESSQGMFLETPVAHQLGQTVAFRWSSRN